MLAGCWGHGFVFALAAGWDSVCSGAGGHRLLVHRRDVCPEKRPGFQRSTSITISLLGHRCASGENSAFCWHLLSPYSSSCADVHPRVASQGKLILFLVNADFLRERPVILWHQVHLSPRPYTAHLHSGPEGTDNLNFKWKIGTYFSLAHLGFRKNIWKQRQLVSKGSLGRGGKYRWKSSAFENNRVPPLPHIPLQRLCLPEGNCSTHLRLQEPKWVDLPFLLR